MTTNRQERFSRWKTAGVAATLLCVAAVIAAHVAGSDAAAEYAGDGAFFCALGALIFDWLGRGAAA